MAVMTKEQIDNMIETLRAGGLDENNLAAVRASLEKQAKDAEDVKKKAVEHKHEEVKEKTEDIKEENKAEKDKAGVLKGIASKAKGRQGINESPEEYERLRQQNLRNGPDVIPIGKRGVKAAVKDENAPTGYTEKSRRKVSDAELEWAKEYSEHMKQHPDEEYQFTTGQKAALDTFNLMEKYKPLTEKFIASQRKNPKKRGPELTDDEKLEHEDFQKQLKDIQWYIPTDEEIEKEKNARAMDIGKRHAKKDTEQREKVEESRRGPSIPFDKSATVMLDFSDAAAKKGYIPINIVSGGRSQGMLLPFQDLLKFRKGINDWSGNSNVSYAINGADARGNEFDSDTIQAYSKAFQTGDFRDTRLPKLVNNVYKKQDIEGLGHVNGHGAYGGQGFLYNLTSDYYTNPEQFKRDHAALVEAANTLGMTYKEYMQFLADQDEKYVGKTEQDIINAMQSRSPDEIKKAVDEYLSTRGTYNKTKSARNKAEMLMDSIKNGGAFKAVVTDDMGRNHSVYGLTPDELLENAQNAYGDKVKLDSIDDLGNIDFVSVDEFRDQAAKSVVGRKRAEIRKGFREQNMETAKKLKSIKREFDNLDKYRNIISHIKNEAARKQIYDALPDNIIVMPEGDIFEIVNGNPEPTGYTVNDIFEENDILDKSIFDEGAIPQEYMRNPNSLGYYNINNNKDVAFKPPVDSSGAIPYFQEIYDSLGGDPLYESLLKFDKRDLGDIIGQKNLGTMLPELLHDVIVGDDGKPLLDAAGRPLKSYRLFLDKNKGRLNKAYIDAGVGVNPGYKHGIDKLKRFRNADGSINTDLYNAYRAAILEASARKYAQERELGKINAINAFQKEGGLNDSQIRNNNILFNKAVQRGLNSGNADDQKTAELAAAELANTKVPRDAYAKRLSSYLSMLKYPEKISKYLVEGATSPVLLTKDELRSIMPLSKYIQAGIDTPERNAAFDKRLVKYLQENGYL